MTTLIIILAIIATISLAVIAGALASKTFFPVPGLRVMEVASSVEEAVPADPIQEQLNALAERLDHLAELLVAVLESVKIDDVEEEVKNPPSTTQPVRASQGSGSPARRRTVPAPARVGNGRRKLKAPTEGAPA